VRLRVKLQNGFQVNNLRRLKEQPRSRSLLYLSGLLPVLAMWFSISDVKLIYISGIV